MGLLDKAGEIDKKPVAKAKPAPKAKPAKAKPVAKEKPAKVAKAKPVREKKERVPREKIDKSFPDDFVPAGKTNRAAAWLVNFIWNWGILIAVLSILLFGATGDMTLPLAGGLLLPIVNVFFIPAKFGRNIGQFVSRTKYVNYKGERPVFLHGIMTNINIPMLFLGLGFLAVSGIGNNSSDGINGTMIALCVICLAFPLSEYVFKKIVGKDAGQGLWDKIFASYQVHHVPTGKETGWLARLESLGEFGAKRIAKIDEKRAAADIDVADDDS